jgi:hypothetical protein
MEPDKGKLAKLCLLDHLLKNSERPTVYPGRQRNLPRGIITRGIIIRGIIIRGIIIRGIIRGIIIINFFFQAKNL